MKSISEMKAAHALRCNVTAKDEWYNDERTPLTPDQEQQLIQIEEDIKRKFADRDLLEVLWKKKRYADSCDKDEILWDIS